MHTKLKTISCINFRNDVGEYITFYWSLYSKKYQSIPEWKKKFKQNCCQYKLCCKWSVTSQTTQKVHEHNSKLWTKKQTYLWDLMFSLCFTQHLHWQSNFHYVERAFQFNFPFTLQNNKMHYVMQLILISWLVNIKYYKNYDIKAHFLVGSARNLNAAMKINAVSGVKACFVIMQQNVTWLFWI